jgi:hypothetical protein
MDDPTKASLTSGLHPLGLLGYEVPLPALMATASGIVNPEMERMGKSLVGIVVYAVRDIEAWYVKLPS